jgi:hypothetical protein
MGTATVGGRQAIADARLGLATVVACVVGYVLFVVLPLRGDGWALPDVAEGPWTVARALAMYLSPVVAGVTAWASVTALATRRGGLATRARRRHVLTLAVGVAHLSLCVATLGAAQLWLD